MKKIFIFLLLLCSIVYSEQKYASLDNYFNSKKYIIEQHHINDKVMFFAYDEIVINSKIFSNGIFYFINKKKEIIPILEIRRNIITDCFGNILFEAVIETQEYYGWSINIAAKNSSFSLQYYTDNGKHITDGPIFKWNIKTSSFKRFEIDRNLY